MYEFFLNMWVLKRLDSSYLQTQVTKGRITQEEATTILTMPQV